jgi:hypothetical protein
VGDRQVMTGAERRERSSSECNEGDEQVQRATVRVRVNGVNDDDNEWNERSERREPVARAPSV